MHLFVVRSMTSILVSSIWLDCPANYKTSKAGRRIIVLAVTETSKQLKCASGNKHWLLIKEVQILAYNQTIEHARVIYTNKDVYFVRTLSEPLQNNHPTSGLFDT